MEDPVSHLQRVSTEQVFRIRELEENNRVLNAALAAMAEAYLQQRRIYEQRLCRTGIDRVG